MKWETVMPIYIEHLETGNEEQKEISKEELMRLARLVDKANEDDSQK